MPVTARGTNGGGQARRDMALRRIAAGSNP